MPSVSYEYEDYINCIDALQSLYFRFNQSGIVVMSGDMNIDLMTECVYERQRAFSCFLNENCVIPAKTTGCAYPFRPAKLY